MILTDYSTLALWLTCAVAAGFVAGLLARHEQLRRTTEKCRQLQGALTIAIEDLKRKGS
jgi:hypothetical protein